MPTVQIFPNPIDRPCTNPDHKAPSKDELDPGLWVHTCPACNWVTTIHVKGPDDK